MEMTVLGVLKMENIQEEDRVKVERIHIMVVRREF
jgi:hypothetical protein